MKAQWFSEPAYYEFARLIESAGKYGGMRTHELFDKFLFCGYAALRQAVHKLSDGEICAKLEAEYMKTIKAIPAPDKFSEAMAMLVAELEQRPRDVLGDVYQQIGMAETSYKGQVFTPSALSVMVGQMTLPEAPDPLHRITIYEPCVGGGAIIISAAQLLKARGFNPWDYFIWAADISYVCFHMAYIQLTLLGVPAIVARQDSLHPESSDLQSPTLLAALYPYRRQIVPDGEPIAPVALVAPVADEPFPELLFS